MHAAEKIRIKFSLEFRKATPQQVSACCNVQASVIIRRLDPVDFRDSDETDFPCALHHEPLRFPPPGLLLTGTANALLGSCERKLEARIVEWLQQVVERSSFERAQRV